METENLISNIIEKSQEAFLLAIEIYNKPTIKYRVEGFNFFICNAWELMLKAYIIKKNGKNSIYYPVKKGIPTRTLSLSDCVKKIFTNDKDPLRINLEQLLNQGINVNALVGIGDDEKDVNMLFRIQELGGTVATVAEEEMYLTNLFSFPKIDEGNYKDIIKQISEKEHSIDMHIIISKFTRNPKGKFSLSELVKSDELAAIKKQEQDRIDELTLLFETGQIDNNYLQKCLYNAELAFRYFTRYCDYGYGRKFGEGKELLQKIWGISEYHSDKAISSNIDFIGIPKIKRLLLSSYTNEN